MILWHCEEFKKKKKEKRADAEFEAAAKKIQIDLEKSLTDTFSNAKNISALDSNTEAIKKLTAEIAEDNAQAASAPLIENLKIFQQELGLNFDDPKQTISQQLNSEIAKTDQQLKAAQAEDIDRAVFDKGLQAMTDIIGAAKKMQLEVQYRDGLVTIVDKTDGSVKFQGTQKEADDMGQQFNKAINRPNQQIPKSE